MTFVLVSSSNELTPEKAFVSLTLFNMIRMPMTSIIDLYLLFSLCFVSYSTLKPLFFQFSSIFSASYVDYSNYSGWKN